MEAANRFGAQAQILHTLVAFDPTFGLGLVVKLLDLQRGQLVQLDFSDVRDNVLVDVVLVVGGGGLPDGRPGVILEPGLSPLTHRELAGLMRVHFPGLFQRRCQLFFAFFLRFSQHVFTDGLAGFRIAARCIAALPAAIFALADVTLAVCSFLGRGLSPPIRSDTPYHTSTGKATEFRESY